jgi:C4-dicarboxylate transporter DctQ subunit
METMLRRAWENLEEGLLCLLLAAMVLITFGTVVTRYVFRLPLSYMDQLVLTLRMGDVPGAAAAVKRRAHLGLSILYDAMPPNARRILDVVILVVTTFFFGVVSWYGVKVVILQVENELMTALGYPSWIVGLAVPVGGGLFILRTIEGFLRHRRGVPEPAPDLAPGI